MERAEMQPANELEDLRSRPLSTWPEKGDAFFAGRVATVFFGALAFLLVGGHREENGFRGALFPICWTNSSENSFKGTTTH